MNVPGCYERIKDSAESLPKDSGAIDLFSSLIDAPLKYMEQCSANDRAAPVHEGDVAGVSDGELHSPTVASPSASAKDMDKVLIVIDGLDECPDAELEQILGLGWWSLPSFVQVLLLGRAHLLDHYSLRGQCRVVDLCEHQPQLVQDLKLFCRGQLKERIDPRDLNEAVSFIVDQSDGSFLYAKSIVQQIRSKPTWNLTELRNLPGNLDHILEAMLARVYDGIDIVSQKLVEQILEVVVSAFEPMTTEVIAAFLLIPQRSGGGESNTDARDLERILQRLSELIYIDSRNNRNVAFHHQWMGEWLISRGSIKAQRLEISSEHQQCQDSQPYLREVRTVVVDRLTLSYA